MGETVACIGMGLLGSALAENLIRAGFTVRGYDIAPERMREHAARGGVAADSPADAARGAGTVVTCLMTADIVREALLGPQGALDAGIAMLDAPVAGSSGQARRREAPVVVGGDRPVFERCRPIFDAIAERAHHVGGHGAGARAKLVVNLVLGLNRLALAEGLLFGLRQGSTGPICSRC